MMYPGAKIGTSALMAVLSGAMLTCRRGVGPVAPDSATITVGWALAFGAPPPCVRLWSMA